MIDLVGYQPTKITNKNGVSDYAFEIFYKIIKPECLNKGILKTCKLAYTIIAPYKFNIHAEKVSLTHITFSSKIQSEY